MAACVDLSKGAISLATHTSPVPTKVCPQCPHSSLEDSQRTSSQFAWGLLRVSQHIERGRESSHTASAVSRNFASRFLHGGICQSIAGVAPAAAECPLETFVDLSSLLRQELQQAGDALGTRAGLL
jgi:hypothetical protein